MEIIKGNLITLALEGEAKIIVHGCNCFHAMGSGIAGALAKKFPEIPAADRGYAEWGDPSILATYSKARVTMLQMFNPDTRQDFIHTLEKPFTCINLYTQYRTGADFLPSLFSKGLRRLNRDFKGQTLWFPMIGCGIGGGDWATVMVEMLTYLPDVNVKVVVL
jgi:O-acetyl-ADP-ribose deacetylase (regulator of RNase III)